MKRSPINKKEQIEGDQKQSITTVYLQFKQRYGSPRIAMELKARGYKISEPTVSKFMRELGLRSKLVKRYKVTTDSNHNYLVVKNVSNSEFTQTEPGINWVTYITFIHVQGGFIYLTTVMDLYDRKIVGWGISKDMTTENTTLVAIKTAKKNRPFEEGLIFHSDQGVQYANYKFSNFLESSRVVRSMSGKANCWDNAVAESFFKSLKTEVFYGYLITTSAKMRTKVFEYIEHWYNKNRRHAHLGYLTIEEFNHLININKVA